MLSQDTSEDMVAMVTAVDMAMEAMDMDVDTMARGRLKLLLKLMLSQDTLEAMVAMDIAMDMEAMVIVVDMEVMDMAVDTMERGKLKLSQDISEDMVVMVVDMDMVVTDMVDMVITVKFLQQFSSLPKYSYNNFLHCQK